MTPNQIATAICKEVAELGDRNSPADWPEAMLVTADELRAIVLAQLENAATPIAWGAFHFGGNRNGELYNHCPSESMVKEYIESVHQRSDSITLSHGPLFAAPQPTSSTPNLENLQDRLLAPTTIDRDDIGHWYHPHLPDCDEGVHYGDLLAVFGMEVATVAMEGDATEEVAERYFEQGGPDCSDWTPTPPEGEGWTLVAIFDTEDGPHAMFARKALPEQFARNYIGPRRWAQRLVKFLNAAAGEGLVLDDIDAANLFTEVLPKTYKAALREADEAATVKPWQPHGFIKPDTLRAVYFYEQDFYVLSNFSAFTLQWDAIEQMRFDTSEAAYHWEKFPGHDDIRAAIINAPSAHEAFKIAEANKAHRRPDWDQVKVQIMRSILRAKVDQHEYVRRKLLATGERELVEDSWRDDFWGWGPNRDGQNMLGKLWMEIRAELRAQPLEGGA